MNNSIKKILGSEQATNTTGLLKSSRYYPLIANFQKIIHEQIPRFNDNTDRITYITSEREEYFNGVNYKRSVIFLLSNGCEWAIKNGHGCTMCGHLAKQTRSENKLSAEEHMEHFNNAIKQIDFKEYPLLSIFNNGSFFNPNEIDEDAQFEISKTINQIDDIKMVVFESRPEFISEEKLKCIKELIPDKHIEVAIGLEIKNDIYRAVCLNKGFSSSTFQKAAKIVTNYFNLRVYVFLKPLFISEGQAIDLAVETINYAFSLGCSTVSLEAATIQKFTLMHLMFKNDLFKPPWLWSIIEVVKRSEIKGKLLIGMFKFYPSPEHVPQNCPKCSEKVIEAFKKFNQTFDKGVFDEINCECKKKWEEEVNQIQPPFSEVLNTTLNKLKERIN